MSINKTGLERIQVIIDRQSCRRCWRPILEVINDVTAKSADCHHAFLTCRQILCPAGSSSSTERRERRQQRQQQQLRGHLKKPRIVPLRRPAATAPAAAAAASTAAAVGGGAAAAGAATSKEKSVSERKSMQTTVRTPVQQQLPSAAGEAQLRIHRGRRSSAGVSECIGIGPPLRRRGTRPSVDSLFVVSII